MKSPVCAGAVLLLVLLGTGFGRDSADAPAAARQVAAFRGTMTLAVDATDTDHQIFNVHETIPVQAPGSMTLLYPQWEVGSHAATASVAELAGLVMRIDGRRIEWYRDPIDVHRFRLDVPAGASEVSVDLQFLAPQGDALLRPDTVNVQWHRLLLYPAGWNVSDIRVAARLTLAPGLHVFSALAIARREGEILVFQPVALDALVDAPVYAGRYWRQIDLAAAAPQPVRLDVISEVASNLEVSQAEVGELRSLVVQAGEVFGAAPFRHYDAIVSLGDQVSAGGIEHTEESENNLPASYFVDGAHELVNRDLIAHEYVHAWNGRYRQPADLWVPDFNSAVGGSLLWVYEGQTEFWGRVLAARSGLRSRQATLDKIAFDAAQVAQRSGRSWKSLADSTNDALYMAGHPVAWRDWQRREDYYFEGVLLWLDVDARLRQRNPNGHGLDEFALHFFAVDRAHSVMLYRFQDVCDALNAVAPADWADFLQRHLNTHDDAEAMAGLARAGWRLVFSDQPSETFRQEQVDAGAANLDYSLGLQVRSNGRVKSVISQGPAFKAGLAPGATISAVNGRPFAPDVLEQAVRAARSLPVTLTVEQNGLTHSAVIDYHGTQRYPRLEPIPGAPDWLSQALQPR